MPPSVHHDVLDVEARGSKAFVVHLQERVNGEKNMWDEMSKLKYLHLHHICTISGRICSFVTDADDYG